MQERATFNNRVYFSYGHFSKGFMFFENEIKTDWINTINTFSIVIQGIKDNFQNPMVTDNSGKTFKLSEEECRYITTTWIEEAARRLDNNEIELKSIDQENPIETMAKALLSDDELNKLKDLNII